MRGGRISLTDAAATLNVDVYHLHGVAKEVADVKGADELAARAASGAQAGPSGKFAVALLQSDLITWSYVQDTVRQTVHDALARDGHVPCSSLALSLGFPSEVVRSIVAEGLRDLEPPARLVRSTVYLESCIDDARSTLRGLLESAAEPLGLDRAAESVAVERELAMDLIRELVDLGEVKGKITGAQRCDTLL